MATQLSAIGRLGTGFTVDENGVISVSGGGGSFIDLSDVPATYGTAGQIPVINATADGLEFADGYTLPTASAGTLGGVKIGSGITITEGVISAEGGGGGGITWNEVTGTTQAAAADNGYIANNEALVTVTLPSSCAVGKVIHVAGKGAGGWTIAQNAGQSIVYGNVTSTTGTGGSVSSTHARDCIGLLCTVADSEFMVFSWVGTVEVI